MATHREDVSVESTIVYVIHNAEIAIDQQSKSKHSAIDIKV